MPSLGTTSIWRQKKNEKKKKKTVNFIARHFLFASEMY